MTDATVRRTRLQRAVGARYDGLHALLVRSVHPLAFGAFTLCAGALAIGAMAIAVEFDDSDAFGIAAGIAISIGVAILAAFTFVFTRVRAAVAIVLLGGWALAVLKIDDIDPGIVRAIWGVASLSVVIQVVLLAWVTPRRIRAGLAHVLLPATLGTIIGAIPVALGLRALLDNDDARALQLAQLAFIGALVVVILMYAMHAYIRWNERKVMREFALRHHLSARTNPEDTGTASLVARFIRRIPDVRPSGPGTARALAGRCAGVSHRRRRRGVDHGRRGRC